MMTNVDMKSCLLTIVSNNSNDSYDSNNSDASNGNNDNGNNNDDRPQLSVELLSGQ